jgi:hypothetical protein
VLIYFIFKYFYIGVLASTIVDANSLIIFYIYMTISVHKKVDANSPNIFLKFFYLTISVHFLWTLIVLIYFIF